jgi:hypothetical protein
MYESGRSGAAARQESGERLRRLEATLARQQAQLRAAQELPDGPGAELLAGVARLLTEELERLRRLLA